MCDIPLLRTERLVLRGWSSQDVDPWRRICGDAETMRHIGDGTPMPPHRSWHAIAHLLGHWSLRGYGMWAVTDAADGTLLGRAGLYEPEGWPGLELGWLIERRHWGWGYATEASRAAAKWAFEVLGAPRLISLIQPANTASIRVAQKLGAHLDVRTTHDSVPVHIYALHRTRLTNALPR